MFLQRWPVHLIFAQRTGSCGFRIDGHAIGVIFAERCRQQYVHPSRTTKMLGYADVAQRKPDDLALVDLPGFEVVQRMSGPCPLDQVVLE